MQTTFILATLAGSALANINMAHPMLKRSVNDLAPRQTDSGIPDISPECQTAVLDVVKTLPTPPPEILSEEMKNPQQVTDPCKFTTPASLSDEYASYSSELLDWYNDNSKSLSSIFSLCSDLTAAAGDLVAFCSTDADVPTLIGGAGGATKTSGSSDAEETSSDSEKTASEAEKPTGTSTDDSSSNEESTSSTSTGGAARETGFAIAALAAVVAAAL
jgi:hypothetical protein